MLCLNEFESAAATGNLLLRAGLTLPNSKKPS
jgi:hypothetical protein